MDQICVERDFITFVKGLLKINDSAIFTINDDKLSCLLGSPDNVCVAYGTYPCTSKHQGSLNIGSLIKLVKALAQTTDEQITLKIAGNNLEYKSPNVRFKYHLLDPGILGMPQLSVKKVNEFVFDVQFSLSYEKLVGLNKFSAFSTDSNKIYLSCNGERVFADLTDKTRANVDSIQFEFGQCSVPFEDIPLSLDFFRSLSYNSTSEVVININSSIGVIAIDIASANYKLRYITSSYTS